MLFVLVSAAALLTTSWTAGSLLPAYAYRGRSATEVQAEEVEVGYVSELFLLRQLSRAFLAAPWTGQGAAKRKREPPPAGWPFPVGIGGADDGAEEGEEAGRRTSRFRLNLSESASVVLRARGERARQQPASSWEGSDVYNNGAAESKAFDSWDGSIDGGYHNDDLSGGGGADGWYQATSPSPWPPSPPSPPPLRFYEVAASGDEGRTAVYEAATYPPAT